jgi:hypothetical protein
LFPSYDDAGTAYHAGGQNAQEQYKIAVQKAQAYSNITDSVSKVYDDHVRRLERMVPRNEEAGKVIFILTLCLLPQQLS